jgi:DNA-binding transcriptional regulator YiaG
VSLGKGASEYLESKAFSEYSSRQMDTEQMDTEQMDTEHTEVKQSYISRYYQQNKDKIHQYRKESGLSERAYKKYYEANKETIKAKNLARYHRKQQEKQNQLEIEQKLKSQHSENSPA